MTAKPIRLALALAFFALTAETATAQDGPRVGQNIPGRENITLRELLEKELRARRPSEFQFIGRVVRAVEDEKLPLDLVLATYRWSKRKSHRPLRYFRKAVEFHADRLGVNLDAEPQRESRLLSLGLVRFFVGFF